MQSRDENGSQLTQEDALPEIPLPTWQWYFGPLGSSLSIISGFAAYFAPLLETEVPRWIWIGIGTTLVLLFVLVPLFLYVKRACQAVRARHRQYPIACAYGRGRDNELEQRGSELQQAQQRVNEILPYVSVFEIKHVIYETVGANEGEIYIVVAKSSEVSLEVGDNLRAVDEVNGQLMGVFEISREREQEYFAKVLEIEPTWKGSIFADGQRQQYPPVNLAIQFAGRRSS